MARWRAAHPEQAREKCRRYRAANPDRVRESQRRTRAARVEQTRSYMATYRETHAERLARWRLEYRASHAEKLRAARKVYVTTEAYREAKRRTEQRDRLSGARAARHAVAREVKAGRLIPKPCERCGAEPVEAHHYLGYAPDHQLHVFWLCRKHHEAAHHQFARANVEEAA